MYVVMVQFQGTDSYSPLNFVFSNSLEIYFDSQAAIKDLDNNSDNSKLTWECPQNLIKLSISFSVTLARVPRLQRGTGNKKASVFVKPRAENPNI